MASSILKRDQPQIQWSWRRPTLQCRRIHPTSHLSIKSRAIITASFEDFHFPHWGFGFTVNLTLIERDPGITCHHMGCLLEKLVHESVFEMRNDKSVEPILYIGLDATPYSACSPQSKPSADVIDIVNRSRVLQLECSVSLKSCITSLSIWMSTRYSI